MLENKILQDEIDYECNSDKYDERINALAEQEDENYEDEIFERLSRE